MSRVFTMLISLLLIASPAKPQDFPEITPDTPVDSATLHSWLVSLDPHLIAWAADFARRRHDAQIVSQIPPLLEQWSLPVLVGSSEERTSHRQVVLALLDTLIQENATVPLNVVESVSDQFPAQALILIKRLPPEAAQPTLMAWTFGTEDRIADRRARAAAMFLAQDPSPEFVGRIVRNAEQHVTLHVVSEAGIGFGGSVMGSCGDSFGLRPEPGWPAVFEYRLRESESASQATGEFPIAQLGLHSIAAERVDSNQAYGDCSVSQSDAASRHELIAHWLGIDPNDMPWGPDEERVIVWTTRDAYERELGSITEEQRSKMLDTFERLHDRDLLEPVPEPKLVVSVHCGMEPCPLDLAHLLFPAPSFLPIP